MIKINLNGLPISDAIRQTRAAMDKEFASSIDQLRREMTADGIRPQEVTEICELERSRFLRVREDYLAELRLDLIAGRRHDFHSDAASGALH